MAVSCTANSLISSSFLISSTSTGPFVLALAQENAIKAGVVSHPSSLKVPEDFNKLLEMSNVPILFNTCEFDVAFGREAQAKADELLGDGKYKPGYKRTYWKGCTHGFAVRGDMVGTLLLHFQTMS